MKLNPISWLSNRSTRKAPVLLSVTSPRTGERTLLGVENFLRSIAIPEPFSLELAGDMDGVTLMARCRDKEVVQNQISIHYPQARIAEVPPEEEPLRLEEDDEAWGMSLRVQGPPYVPLRTFRDDDLLDPGSDPILALLGTMASLRPGERMVARLVLSSLGPDWSQPYLDKALPKPVTERRDASYTYQTKPLQTDGALMAVLGLIALGSLQGYFWMQGGELWKTVLLGIGVVAGTVAAGWGWWRWKKRRSRVYDPILVKEKVSSLAFDSLLQVTAILPKSDGKERAKALLESVAAAYRHYDNC